MTMPMEDVLETQDDTLPIRLRQAREDMGFSRAELARRTGIPAKSIEKFEFGTQEPSVSRLQTLSKALEVTFQSLAGLDEDPDLEPDPSPEDADNPRPVGDHMPANDNSTIDQVRELLERLDDMRVDEFDGTRRQAMAMARVVLERFTFLEPDELTALAGERGLYMGDCPTSANILDVFVKSPEDAQSDCGSIEERILDTAILGVDLFAIERRPLTDAADSIPDIEEPFFGWGEHADFVPLIREPLRLRAFAGNGIDFGDRESFPRRQ